MLLVDGEAVNDGSDTRTLPPLDINVTANDGVVTRYNLGTSAEPVGAGRNIRLFEPPRSA